MEPSHLLHQITETLSEGVAVTDDCGRLVLANQALEQLLGYGQGELLGQPWTLLFPRGPDDPVRVPLAEELDGTASQHEVQLLCKNGTTVPVLVRCSLLAQAGSTPSVLTTFVDMRESRHLGVRIDQLEKAALVGQNGLSLIHELNNSLTILLLQVQLLSRKGSGTVSLDENLTIMLDQVRRMRQMVDNLRTFADPYRLHLSSIDVNLLVKQTLDLHELELQMEGIQVVTDLKPGLPNTGADAYKLQQVFVNLINNARQAIKAVGDRGRLAITTDWLPGGGDLPARIQVRFADTGAGIPADVMPHIFESFFTTKEPGQGMGLGLSICQEIVQRHGGRIWAENNDEGGASFMLELPVTDQDRGREMPPAGRSSLESENELPRQTRVGRRILIVDDEPSMTRSVEQILRQAGFEVMVATEAEQALAFLEQDRIDLIVSDLAMPRMDGQQFWQAVRERHPELATRIIFSSGDSSSQRARAFLEESRCIWVEKPFKSEELLRLIQQALPDR
jgi:PAS domain S-box-containing protein